MPYGVGYGNNRRDLTIDQRVQDALNNESTPTFGGRSGAGPRTIGNEGGVDVPGAAPPGRGNPNRPIRPMNDGRTMGDASMAQVAPMAPRPMRPMMPQMPQLPPQVSAAMAGRIPNEAMARPGPLAGMNRAQILAILQSGGPQALRAMLGLRPPMAPGVERNPRM